MHVAQEWMANKKGNILKIRVHWGGLLVSFQKEDSSATDVFELFLFYIICVLDIRMKAIEEIIKIEMGSTSSYSSKGWLCLKNHFFKLLLHLQVRSNQNLCLRFWRLILNNIPVVWTTKNCNYIKCYYVIIMTLLQL